MSNPTAEQVAALLRLYDLDLAGDPLTAAAMVHTGAMIALVPSDADLERLAFLNGEPVEDLHLTLAFLGKGDEIDADTRHRITMAAVQYFTRPITAEAFSVNVFNPHASDRDTALVLGIKGEDLVDPRNNVVSAVRGFFAMPEQHEPWIPHVTLAYTDDMSQALKMKDRLGPITFDKLRLAFAGDVMDIHLDAPLTASAFFTQEVPMIIDGDVPVAAEEPAAFAEWEGILTVEGIESGDGRLFSYGALDWAQLPLPLMYQPANVGGHSGSVLVGQITNVFRKGNRIFGTGLIDLQARFEGENIGLEVQRLMGQKLMNGVSVDVDKVKNATIEQVFDASMKPTMTIFHQGRVRGATLVAFPAFTEAQLFLTGDTLTASAAGEVYTVRVNSADQDVCPFCPELPEPLVAAGHTITIPDLPPAWWFDQPTDVQLKGALTVTDEGRVYGLLAPKNTTHRAVKTKVPTRNVDYTRFMKGETIVEGGGRVVTGVVTMGCGHAPVQNYGTLEDRISHYDNSCSVAANIRIGETDDGEVWVAGATAPFATAEQVSRMLACTLSGDWQPHPDRPGVREFIAALLVPVPGFAMARTEASVQYEEGALVASTVPVEFRYDPGQPRGDDGRWTDGNGSGSSARRILADEDMSDREVIAAVNEMDRADWDSLSAGEKDALHNAVRVKTAGKPLVDRADDDEPTAAGRARNKIARWSGKPFDSGDNYDYSLEELTARKMALTARLGKKE